MRLFCRSDCQSLPAGLQVSFLSYFRVTVAEIKYHYQKQAGAGMGLFCLHFKSTAKEVSVEIKAGEKVGEETHADNMKECCLPGFSCRLFVPRTTSQVTILTIS